MNEGERDVVLAELVRAPFLPKPLLNPPKQFGYPTRFSEGDWPVYYSSLDALIAEAEIAYHYGVSAREDPAERRPVFYALVRCEFAGSVVDLVSKKEQPGWEALTSNDYRFCQTLGREAVEMDIGGFLTPSARADGTNLPVFRSETLSKAALGRTARFSYDAATDHVSVDWIVD